MRRITCRIAFSGRYSRIHWRRQDNNPNGQIARYAVHTSVDGKNWGSPVAEGSWTAGSASKDVRFAQPVETQFVKLEALSEVRGAAYASAAELELILAQ